MPENLAAHLPPAGLSRGALSRYNSRRVSQFQVSVMTSETTIVEDLPMIVHMRPLLSRLSDDELLEFCASIKFAHRSHRRPSSLSCLPRRVMPAGRNYQLIEQFSAWRKQGALASVSILGRISAAQSCRSFAGPGVDKAGTMGGTRVSSNDNRSRPWPPTSSSSCGPRATMSTISARRCGNTSATACVWAGSSSPTADGSKTIVPLKARIAR